MSDKLLAVVNAYNHVVSNYIAIRGNYCKPSGGYLDGVKEKLDHNTKLMNDFIGVLNEVCDTIPEEFDEYSTQLVKEIMHGEHDDKIGDIHTKLTEYLIPILYVRDLVRNREIRVNINKDLSNWWDFNVKISKIILDTKE